MPKATIQDRLVVALTNRGHRRVPNPTTRKFVVFESVTKPGTFLYLGKSGALRYGETIGRSVPVDRFKAELLKS